jgi:hypothetical protein
MDYCTTLQECVHPPTQVQTSAHPLPSPRLQVDVTVSMFRTDATANHHGGDSAVTSLTFADRIAVHDVEPQGSASERTVFAT